MFDFGVDKRITTSMINTSREILELSAWLSLRSKSWPAAGAFYLNLPFAKSQSGTQKKSRSFRKSDNWFAVALTDCATGLHSFNFSVTVRKVRACPLDGFSRFS